MTHLLDHTHSHTSHHLYTQTTGDVRRYNTADDDNFSQVSSLSYHAQLLVQALLVFLAQVTNFWLNVLTREEKARLVQNIAGHMKDAKESIQKRAVSAFTHIAIV